MKIARHILARSLAESTLHLQDQKQLAREIAAYLLAERRTSELESILRDIMEYRAERGILEAEVVTAHEVQPHVLDDVRQLLQSAYPNAKTVHVGTRHDASVIGGLRVDMPNEQLDMTVAGKLANFKRLTAGEHA